MSPQRTDPVVLPAAKVVVITAALAAMSVSGCSTIGEDEIERGTVPLPDRLPELRDLAAEVRWPEWRGVRRNGTAGGVELPADLPEATWPEAWRVTVGPGLSGPVAQDNRVYCHSRVGDREVVSCHDGETGDILWSQSSPLQRSFSHPLGGEAITDGPLATPSIQDDRLYTVGVVGRVRCFDARDGSIIFDVTPEELDGAPSRPAHGHAASPLVRDGRLYVSFKTGKGPQFLALDAETGELLWRSIGENITYTSPVYATIDGTPQVIVRTWERLAGLLPESGELLWEHWAPARNITRDCATPLVVGNIVYLTNDYHGTLAVEVSRDDAGWRAERLWRSGGLAGGTASPVYHEGYLYGLHRRGRFACLDARTGERVWVTRAFGSHLSMISLGAHALALDETGTLTAVRLSPSGYDPLATWKVGEYTWGHPGIDEKRIYLRDGGELVALKW